MNVVTQFPAVRDYERDVRFQAMFEGVPIGLGICQLDGRVVEANSALTRMFGYGPQELCGTHSGELYPELGRQLYSQLYSDDHSPAEQLLDELMRGERGWFEIEKRYRRKDGSEFWGHLTVSLGRDARRQPAFLIAMLSDATERRRLEEHLREAEKIEVLGRLAGGIAHDFNNLLTGILLYCDLLNARLQSMGGANGDTTKPGLTNQGLPNQRLTNERLTNPELENHKLQSELRQHVEEVRSAGEQGAALTHQLLAIARRQATEPRPIAINEIVVSTQNLLRRLIGEQIELIVVLDPSLDPALNSGAGLVLADPAQLRQILLNLVLNARDAMPRGGKIRLITRTAESPDTQSHREAGPGKTRRAVSLTVKDNGCGMDAETRSRLFEPFFTTKNPGEGTGLGLATVQRIVSTAGGWIEVDSEPGRGTSIEVFLPVIESATATSSSSQSLSSQSLSSQSLCETSSSRTRAPEPSP